METEEEALADMEGLAGASSVTAIIDISAQIFMLCHKYLSEVKDAKQDIRRLRDEVTSLQNVLENVADFADADASAKLSTLSLLNQPDGPVQQCQAELEGLFAKLKAGRGDGGDMKKFGLRALGWPFKKKDVDSTVEVISRYKATFNLALTADTA